MPGDAESEGVAIETNAFERVTHFIFIWNIDAAGDHAVRGEFQVQPESEGWIDCCGVVAAMTGRMIVPVTEGRDSIRAGMCIAALSVRGIYSLASMRRPCASCRGRELILYSKPNARSWSRLMVISCSKMNQRTPSVHGGAVSEPMYVQ